MKWRTVARQKQQLEGGKDPHTPPAGEEDGAEERGELVQQCRRYEGPNTMPHRGGDAEASTTTPGEGCIIPLVSSCTDENE